MLPLEACEAMRSGRVLEVYYDGHTRLIEVHSVGFTEDDNPIMRVWQLSGGSNSNETMGWKLLRLNEISNAHTTEQASEAPRPGYKAGDPAMKLITCQL